MTGISDPLAPEGEYRQAEGGIFHVTHRCHNRDFLLRFACDRDAYRARLREHLPQFQVALLDYCITSNHVHFLLDTEERLQISGLMRTTAGEFARAYNRRKERMNAFLGRYLPCHSGGRGSRQETELVQPDPEVWVLQEAPVPYGAKTGSKNAANRQN